MSERPLLWIIYIILFGLGVALAFRGWQALQHTTILVEWTTASELDTVGYNLYRSEVPGEKGSQVNQEMIPSSSDPLTGGSYKFEDHNAQPGKKYYYSLEEVESSGSVNDAGTIEVTAQQNGWWQIGLATLILGGVLTGILSQVRYNRKKR